MSTLDATIIMGCLPVPHLLVLLPRAALLRRPLACSCHHAPRLSSLPSGLHVLPTAMYLLLMKGPSQHADRSKVLALTCGGARCAPWVGTHACLPRLFGKDMCSPADAVMAAKQR